MYKDKEKARIQRQKWYEKNKEKYKEKRINNKEYRQNYDLKRKYHISLEDKNTLITAQDNKCGICERKFDYLSIIPVVDHCHNGPKKVRGILCKKCNSGIGVFRDNIDNLKKAIKWITKNQQEQLNENC